MFPCVGACVEDFEGSACPLGIFWTCRDDFVLLHGRCCLYIMTISILYLWRNLKERDSHANFVGRQFSRIVTRKLSFDLYNEQSNLNFLHNMLFAVNFNFVKKSKNWQNFTGESIRSRWFYSIASVIPPSSLFGTHALLNDVILLKRDQGSNK